MPLEKSSSDKLLVSQNRESRTKCKRDRRRDRSESSDSSTSSSESRSSSSRSPPPKRRHSSEKNSRSRKKSLSSRNRKKRASTSSDSSSSSPSKVIKRKEKKQKRKHKKEKKKKKKEEKYKTSNKMVTAQVNSLAETSVKPKSSAASGSTLGPAPRVLKPMTKEEWEKQQSVMRYVYDEETGRNRLIKGDGEVMEEIVTRDKHREINKTATKGDGNFFASKMGLH